MLSIVCSVFLFHSLQREIADSRSYRPTDSTFDTIGYSDSSKEWNYPQIDAVYTWVNGSDPIWLREMMKYKSLYNKEHNLTEDEDGDTATSSNRFRDNDELK